MSFDDLRAKLSYIFQKMLEDHKRFETVHISLEKSTISQRLISDFLNKWIPLVNANNKVSKVFITWRYEHLDEYVFELIDQKKPTFNVQIPNETFGNRINIASESYESPESDDE